MTFKEKLVILRKAKGLTQDEFAAAVGVSRQAVYKWECGQSYPEVPKLLEMKLLFSISIDELLDDSFDIPIPEKKKRKRVPKETAEKIEREVKSAVIMPKAVPAPMATPAPMAAPAPTSAPTPKAIPDAPTFKVAPTPMATPIIPKAESAPKIEIPVYSASVEEKPVIDEATNAEKKIFIPTPAQLEENEYKESPAINDEKDEPKKGGLFGRLFGRK